MTRAHLLSIRFADGAYGIRDSSVGGMVPKMNAHAGAFSSDSGRHVPRWVSIAASDPVRPADRKVVPCLREHRTRLRRWRNWIV